jgi:prolyl-tRNA synthetase
LLGTVVELLSDDAGIVWPESIAPYSVHLISLAGKNESVTHYADALYANLVEQGIEVLYDDRDVPAGEKFADSDLLGIPHRLVVGARVMEKKMIEYKKRTSATPELLPESVAMKASFLTR